MPVFLALAWYFWWLGAGALFYMVLAVFLVVSSLFGETAIDPAHRTIERTWRLFALLPVRRWRRDLSGFVAVRSRLKEAYVGETTSVEVGLIDRDGRLLVVQYFSAGSDTGGRKAKQLKRALATSTGLPIVD